MVFARLGLTHDSGLTAAGESSSQSKATKGGTAFKSA